jgi:hypothetical protein
MTKAHVIGATKFADFVMALLNSNVYNVTMGAIYINQSVTLKDVLPALIFLYYQQDNVKNVREHALHV